jgi:hypothetical protein
MLKAAWHWGSDSSVINDNLGEPGCTLLYVSLPSTWGSVDGDHMFSLHIIEGLLSGDSDRYKWMNKPLVLETQHLSQYRPCWGNMEGAPLLGTLRVFYFDIHICVPCFGPWGCCEFKFWYWGGNLSPHSVWVRGLGHTQTCISGFLLFGPWECYESKYRGPLELW